MTLQIPTRIIILVTYLTALLLIASFFVESEFLHKVLLALFVGGFPAAFTCALLAISRM